MHPSWQRLASSFEAVEKLTSMAPATVPVAIQGPLGLKAILADRTASFTAMVRVVFNL